MRLQFLSFMLRECITSSQKNQGKAFTLLQVCAPAALSPARGPGAHLHVRPQGGQRCSGSQSIPGSVVPDFLSEFGGQARRAPGVSPGCFVWVKCLIPALSRQYIVVNICWRATAC